MGAAPRQAYGPSPGVLSCHGGPPWPSLHYATRADIFGRGDFHGQNGSQHFRFINAMIFAFTTFVKNNPLYGKIASKV